MDHRPGFRSLDESAEATDVDLDVDGSIPDWLEGRLVRNGPGTFEDDEVGVDHWFDGMALLHRFEIDGAADLVSYSSRFLRTDAYEGYRDGDLRYSEFATDPCEGIFGRFFSYFTPPEPTDNTSVNVVEREGETYALTETTMPVKFDQETLETLDVGERRGDVTTAHPYRDPDTGEEVSYVVEFGRSPEYQILVDDGERDVLAKVPVDEPAYMHSFAATEDHVVLVEFPHRVRPRDLVLGSSTVAESYSWRSGEDSRFLVIERDSGDVVAEAASEAFFGFHHVNAYDDGGEILVDVAAYEDSSVIDALYLDRVREKPPLDLPGAELRRYRVDVEAEEVGYEVVYPRHIELPRVAGSVAGRRYRYVYGVGNRRTPPETLPNRLVKVDVEEREVETWSPGGFPSEPVFVAAPDGDSEDDGALLTVVLDPEEETSSLVVLDAENLDVLAQADVGTPLPFSFHGRFLEGS